MYEEKCTLRCILDIKGAGSLAACYSGESSDITVYEEKCTLRCILDIKGAGSLAACYSGESSDNHRVRREVYTQGAYWALREQGP